MFKVRSWPTLKMNVFIFGRSKIIALGGNRIVRRTQIGNNVVTTLVGHRFALGGGPVVFEGYRGIGITAPVGSVTAPTTRAFSACP
jgi:hypothetical protein